MSAERSTAIPCREIVVIEDDLFIQQAIRDMVKEANFAEIVTVFERATPAIAHIQKRDCDIVLVDLGLPDMSGIEAIEQLRATGSKADIMVVTTSQNSQKIVASIQAGAAGYFLKSNLHADLLPYLTALRRGGSPIDPIIARRLLDMIRTPQPAATLAPTASPTAASAGPTGTRPLSEQETRILTYVAKGFTSKEIAELLTLSPLTVSTHIRNIYRKLAVKTRTEAVFEASNQGLIPPVHSNAPAAKPGLALPRRAFDDEET